MGTMPRDGMITYVDKRNWVEYNEGLVRRGELYLSLDFMDHRDEEIERTNKGKRGRPYEYPWSMFEFLGYVHNLLMPFRQIPCGVLASVLPFLGPAPVGSRLLGRSSLCPHSCQMNLRGAVSQVPRLSFRRTPRPPPPASHRSGPQRRPRGSTSPLPYRISP